ncbi:MAG: hypothetical protein OXE59_11575 [Bacteroidetes bacterium]|nr:hypothetical protein [Bacteroidota bacterium]MCY4234362.1 hypothetical protein [Bacteroidota bacterium]
MAIAIHIGLLILSVYVIVKSSDSLVDLASGIGQRANLSDFFIGSFLVGIGTSLPELFTSIAAANSGTPELVSPNVFGTVVANLGAGFGLGVLSLFFFVRLDDGHLRVFTRAHALSNGYLDFSNTNVSPILFASLSVLLAVALCYDGLFDRLDAVIFFICYVGFMGWQFYQSRQPTLSETSPPSRKEIGTSKNEHRLRTKALVEIVPACSAFILAVISVVIPSFRQELMEVAEGSFAVAFFLVGLILLLGLQLWDYWPELTSRGGPELSNVASVPVWIGLILFGVIIAILYSSGVIVVGSLVKLSEDLGINSGALAASALAIGTSLPDIVVALNVVRRGRHKLLVGHIFQSNVFDVFLIMAICGLIVPLPEVNEGSSIISIWTAVILTLPLLLTLRYKKISGIGGLLLFIGFMVFLFYLYG